MTYYSLLLQRWGHEENTASAVLLPETSKLHASHCPVTMLEIPSGANI